MNYIKQHLFQSLNVFIDEFILKEVRLLAVLYVIVNVLLDVLYLLDLHLVIVHHPQQCLQLLDVVPMLLNPGLKVNTIPIWRCQQQIFSSILTHLTLFPPLCIIILLFPLLPSGREGFYLSLKLVHLDVEGVYALVQPLLHAPLLSLGRIHLELDN